MGISRNNKSVIADLRKRISRTTTVTSTKARTRTMPSKNITDGPESSCIIGEYNTGTTTMATETKHDATMHPANSPMIHAETHYGSSSQTNALLEDSLSSCTLDSVEHYDAVGWDGSETFFADRVAMAPIASECALDVLDQT